MRKFEDLTGKRFGKLTVIKFAYSNKKSRYWECKCDCGNTTFVPTQRLKGNKTRSCGCLLKETSGTNHHNFKGNEYDYNTNEKIYIGKVKDEKFIINEEDYPLVSQHRWNFTSGRESVIGKYFYARMSRKSSTGNKIVMLHNFIWELHNGPIPNGYRIDHIDRNPQNCRLENLRLADKSLNAYNTINKKKSNTGVVGVSYISKENKYHADSWRAYINYQKKRIELGYFDKFEKALKKRLEAELKYYGEYCPSNKFIAEQYFKGVNNGK